MKRLFVILAVIGLSGCASIMDKIPSRWDVNQARVVTDLRQSAMTFDCKADQRAQLAIMARQLQWFELYSQSKGTRDVAKLGSTIDITVKEFDARLDKGPVSPIYCDLKKKLFVQQTDIMARAVQGRF